LGGHRYNVARLFEMRRVDRFPVQLESACAWAGFERVYDCSRLRNLGAAVDCLDKSFRSIGRNK
jgi:hypothetical protein